MTRKILSPIISDKIVDHPKNSWNFPGKFLKPSATFESFGCLP
jgi:hypothetical protein